MSDGTTGGTHRIRQFDLPLGVSLDDDYPYAVGDLTAFGDRLLFTVATGGKGRELWMTDGSSAGTRLLKDIFPGANGSTSDADTLTRFVVPTRNGPVCLFTADDGVHGMEVWRTDGTTAGTRLVADILPGRDGSGPGGFVTAGGKVFFSASDDQHGLELWTVPLGRID